LFRNQSKLRQLTEQKRQLSELTTPKTFRHQVQVSSTPLKATQDDNTSSSHSSDFTERWTVVEKSSRRLKYSQVVQSSSDSSPESESSSDGLRLYVNQLSLATDEESLHKYFSKFGVVDDIFLRGPGFAFVTFRSFYNESPLMIQDHVINGR
jgi:RNA recognition motif-containing protein